MNADDKAPEAQVKYVKDNIDSMINHFRGRAKDNNNRAFVFKTLSVTFGTITTVLLGIGRQKLFDNASEYISLSALIASGLVSIITAWEGFFKPGDLWVINTEATQKLIGLRDALAFLESSSDGVSKKQACDFFTRAQKIRDDGGGGWSTGGKSGGK